MHEFSKIIMYKTTINEKYRRNYQNNVTMLRWSNVQRWKQAKRGVCNVCCNMDVTVNCQLMQSQLTNYNNNDNR